MNKRRLKEIENKAVSLLKEYGEYQIPTLVDRLVLKMNIDLEANDLGSDVSGVFISNGEVNKIVFSQNDNPNRQRFTIAHELGHYALEHRRQGVFIDTPQKFFTILYRDKQSSNGEYLQEREANAFAATLLMPEELVEKQIKEIIDSESFFSSNNDLVVRLAEKFKVSCQAMSFRLSALGYNNF